MQVWALELTRTDAEGYVLIGEWAVHGEAREPFTDAALEITLDLDVEEFDGIVYDDGAVAVETGIHRLALTLHQIVEGPATA